MKKSMNDAVLLFIEIIFLALGPALFAGGLFPIVLSQELGFAEYRAAVVSAIMGVLFIIIAGGIAVYRYLKYS